MAWMRHRRCAEASFVIAIVVAWSAATHCPADQVDDDNALRAYYSGNGFLQRGLDALAADEYRKFLDAHPNHEKAPMARYGLGVSLYRQGELAAAAEQLAQLSEVRSFAFEADVLAMLGRCQLATGDAKGAAGTFARFLHDHADHALAPEVLIGLAEAQYRTGRLDDAVDACRTFRSRSKNHALSSRSHYFEGLALLAMDKPADAAEQFRAVLTSDADADAALREHADLLLAQSLERTNALADAVRQYRAVLERGGAYAADALAGLGIVLQRQGDAKQADAQLEKFLKQNDDHPMAGEARYFRARALFDEGKFDDAYAAFDAVADAKGDRADEAVYWQAKCRLQQSQFDDAAKLLKSALRKFDDSSLRPQMQYDLGVALFRGGDLDGAVQAFETFIAEQEDHDLAAEARYTLALAEHRRGNYDASLEHCRAFAKKRSSNEETAAAVAFLAAENDYLAERYEDAVRGYVAFAKKYPNNGQVPTAGFRAGMAQYRLGKLDDAREQLSQVAERAKREPAYRPALLALGDIAFQQSDWATAERRLSAFLEGAADAANGADDALLKLGLARQRQGNNKHAIAAFDLLLAQHADSPHALQATFERGQALMALEQYDEAAAAFEKVVSAGGSRFAPYANEHLGVIALKRGKYDDAAKRFERARTGDADSATATDALYRQGVAQMAAGELKAAEQTLATFIENNSDHPKRADAQARRAIALSRLDRTDDALQAIAQLERSGWDNLDAVMQDALSYEKAWGLRESGDTAAAVTAYRKLIESTADTRLRAHAQLAVGEIESAAGNHEAAAQMLRPLREGHAAAPAIREQALYRLGVCEFELGKHADAADVLGELISEFPESEFLPSASFFCGEAMFKTGDTAKAADHLSRVVNQFKNDGAYGPALLRLGECLAAGQRWTRSEAAFADYLNRFPDTDAWYQAQFGVGWARENQSRYDEAIEAYRPVVDRHKGPTAARAQFQIGECLYAKKQYADAVRELLRVDILFAYPEWSSAALYEAGRCFEQLGQQVEARQQFKQVVERFPDSEWARLSSARLEQLAGVLPGR